MKRSIDSLSLAITIHDVINNRIQSCFRILVHKLVIGSRRGVLDRYDVACFIPLLIIVIDHFAAVIGAGLLICSHYSPLVIANNKHLLMVHNHFQ